MSPITSPKQICEALWDLEERFGLLRKPLRGVKVWQLLRMEIYYRVAQATGVYNTPHTNKDGLLDALKALPSVLGALAHPPSRGDYQRDILVFDHMRKIPVGGTYVDIYTKHLLDSLEEGSFDVIESVYLGRHLTPKAPNRSYLDRLAAKSYLRSRLTRVPFTPKERAFIDKIVGEIDRRFGARLPLRKMFAREITHFRTSVADYAKLLEKRHPKKIYLVVSYSFYKRPLIAAAKAQGIPTLELQHGTLSPYHLGYNFPGCDEPLDYFPDRFLTFGDYWKEAAHYPLPPENIETYGFPYFHEQKKRYEDVKKKPNQILFISQGVIGKKLSALAVECAKHLKDKQIVFKLHPGEYDRWREEYTELVEARDLDNLQVVDHNEKNLYEYFAESTHQVGVFSTAIYEGLAFGCRTFIADLPGAEYMDDLVEKKIVRKIKSAAELIETLEVPFDVSFDSAHFFR